MTLTLSPRPSRHDQEAEALIREARRLQLRRRRRRMALLVAVLLVAAGVLTSLRGGHPAPPRPAVRPAHPPIQRRVQGPSLGSATAYQLTGPTGVAVDHAGDIYFSDGNRVLEVDHATGQLEVVAGTGAFGYSGDRGPGSRATLDSPGSVVVAPNGDVYFEDGNRIRKVSAANGVISTVAGNGRTGFRALESRSGNGGPAVRASLILDTSGAGSGGRNDALAFGPHGYLYIADSGNDEVQKVSLRSGIITRVTGGRAPCASDNGICMSAVPSCPPVGLAVDGSSNVFMATGCGAIREMSGTTGAMKTVFSVNQVPALAGQGGTQDPSALTVLADKKLLVTDAYGRRLLEIDLHDRNVTMVAGTGEQTLPEPGQTAGDGGPAAKATFGLALGAAVDGRGDVFVADYFNNAVREIDARTGVITTVAGHIPTSPEEGHCC
jgi:sugar lactone lactonase YvrE